MLLLRRCPGHSAEFKWLWNLFLVCEGEEVLVGEDHSAQHLLSAFSDELESCAESFRRENTFYDLQAPCLSGAFALNAEVPVPLFFFVRLGEVRVDLVTVQNPDSDDHVLKTVLKSLSWLGDHVRAVRRNLDALTKRNAQGLSLSVDDDLSKTLCFDSFSLQSGPVSVLEIGSKHVAFKTTGVADPLPVCCLYANHMSENT